MTDVGDWARERAYEAAGRFGTASDPERAFYVAGFVQGASDLANLLVSDEALKAHASVMVDGDDLYEYPYTEALRLGVLAKSRAALQAALNAISTTTSPGSETGEDSR